MVQLGKECMFLNGVFYDCKKSEQKHIILGIYSKMLLKKSGHMLMMPGSELGVVQIRINNGNTIKKNFPGPVHKFQADWQ